MPAALQTRSLKYPVIEHVRSWALRLKLLQVIALVGAIGEGSAGRSGGRARRRLTQRAVVEAQGPSAIFRLVFDGDGKCKN